MNEFEQQVAGALTEALERDLRDDTVGEYSAFIAGTLAPRVAAAITAAAEMYADHVHGEQSWVPIAESTTEACEAALAALRGDAP